LIGFAFSLWLPYPHHLLTLLSQIHEHLDPCEASVQKHNNPHLLWICTQQALKDILLRKNCKLKA
jgi:hypothetical protein